MPQKNAAAVALGKRGGHARARNMTAEQRSESARKAIRARWAKADKLIKQMRDAEKEVLNSRTARKKGKKKP